MERETQREISFKELAHAVVENLQDRSVGWRLKKSCSWSTFWLAEFLFAQEKSVFVLLRLSTHG